MVSSAGPVWWMKKHRRRSARWSRASITAVLTRWAPWLPPSTRTVNGRCGPEGTAMGCVASPEATSTISRRRGLPVQRVLPGSKPPSVRSNAVKIRSASRARSRLVMPGSVFCSHRAIGMRSSQAARTTGPAE